MFDWLTTAAVWWGGAALGGGAVLLIGCLLMRIAREPATRQRIGEIAVVAALLVAVLRLGPTWLALPSFASPANAAAVPNTLPSDLNSWVVMAPTPDTGSERAAWNPATEVIADPPQSSWTWSDVAAIATAVYLGVVTLFLGRWMLGQWALARLRRMSRPASARSRSLFAMMANGAIWPSPRLGLTERLRLPVAFGLRRPAVLLPASFERQADETTLRWVFAHELTHLRRRDPWSYWAFGLAQAVYFYVPWFWSLKRQVRLCQEYIADAAAAREGTAADEYAQFLVSLAKCPATPLGAAGLGSSSDLFRRVNMLLQTSRGPSDGSRSSVGLPAFGLMVAAILASGLGVRAEPPAKERQWNDITDKVIVLDDLQGVEFQDWVLKLVGDEDQDAKKDDAKKDKEKSEKKRVFILQQDGKNIVTIPADADADEVKRLIEKAMSAAKKQSEAAAKQADAARKAEQTAREKAKQAAEQARRSASDARKEIEKELKAAEKARKEAMEKMEKVTEERAKIAEAKPKVVEGRAVRAMGGDMRLGLQLEKPSSAMADQLNLSSGAGLLIAGVVDGSPAAKAGFKSNDILVQFAGKPVSNDANEFIQRVREMKGDDAVEAVVLRKGKKERIRGIKLGEAKSGGAAFRFVPAEKLDEMKNEGFRFEPKIMKDGKVEFKMDGMPKFDAKDFKFDIQLDGLKGIDGRKLSDEIKKNIELKLEPLQKNLDPKKLQEMQKHIELHLQPLREKIDSKKIEEIQKDLELKIQPMIKEKLEPKLKDLKKQIELQVEPLKKIDAKKLDGIKKDLEVQVLPRIKNLDADVQKRIKELNPSMDFIVVPGEKSSSGKKSEKSANKSVSVSVNDGEFKAVQKEDKLEITVIGTADGDKIRVSEIKIYGDGEKANYRSIDDVPSKYRDKVKKLISNQDGSPVRFRFQRDEQ